MTSATVGLTPNALWPNTYRVSKPWSRSVNITVTTASGLLPADYCQREPAIRRSAETNGVRTFSIDSDEFGAAVKAAGDTWEGIIETVRASPGRLAGAQISQAF